MLAARTTDLTTTATWRAAADALVAATAVSADPTPLRAVLTELATGRQPDTPDRGDTLSAARELAAGTATEALLAVAVTHATGAATGWPPEWRDLVHVLRRHADPDVRHRARHAVTAPE